MAKKPELRSGDLLTDNTDTKADKILLVKDASEDGSAIIVLFSPSGREFSYRKKHLLRQIRHGRYSYHPRTP